MIQGENCMKALCFSLLLPFSLLSAARTQSQTVPALDQHTASDVVMLSLEALSPQTELRRQVGQGMMGSSAEQQNAEKRLLEIQMNIVRETAKFGPVLLLAPDEATKSDVARRCQEFQICELLKSDRVRMKVVPHDGVWIRDFGPQIEAIADSAHVAHWRYFDIRTEEAKQQKVKELENARLKLFEARQLEDRPDALTQESTPDARKAVASAIDDKLYLLRQYSEILKEASPQRTKDENSAFDIADAVLASPDFGYKSSALALDGGNLLKLEDGRCLTTRVLLSRNKDQNINVDQELEKTVCKVVTYLDPLPGPVIEHIDLFVLPAGGKRILLASYDLSQPFAAEYWGKLSDAERDLATNADLAMELDAERLRRLGYEVVPVASPFPRIPANGHTYYPSVLNALVRAGTDGYKQILVPSYKDYETDVQAAALKQIEDVFGPKTQIVSIEATEAAKGQGAIHCLTLSAPLPLSIFGDSTETAKRTEVLARKEQLDRSVAAQIASQIPSTGLQGSWAILEENERPDESPLELYPQRIFFGRNEFQKGVFDQLESKGTYTIDRKYPASWTLHFLFANQNATPGVAQWINKDEVRLIFADGDSTLVLRRISDGQASPFKAEKQGSQQTQEKTGGAGKKDPGHGPSTTTRQAPAGLERVQP
jgi:agmatine/peptidylarginine deiminase